MPVMGEHQRGAVLSPIPEGFRLFCPFCFLLFLHKPAVTDGVPRAKEVRRLWQDSELSWEWDCLRLPLQGLDCLLLSLAARFTPN